MYIHQALDNKINGFTFHVNVPILINLLLFLLITDFQPHGVANLLYKFCKSTEYHVTAEMTEHLEDFDEKSRV